MRHISSLIGTMRREYVITQIVEPWQWMQSQFEKHRCVTVTNSTIMRVLRRCRTTCQRSAPSAAHHPGSEFQLLHCRNTTRPDLVRRGSDSQFDGDESSMTVTDASVMVDTCIRSDRLTREIQLSTRIRLLSAEVRPSGSPSKLRF